MFKKLTLFFLLLIFALSSCDNDDSNTLKQNQNTPYSKIIEKENKKVEDVISLNTKKNDFIVKIKDENLLPLENAEVEIGNNSYFTDNLGIIQIKKIKTNESYVVIKARKSGYEETLKTIIPSETQETPTELVLLKKINSIELQAEKGGKLEKDNITLSFPENSIVNENGEIYKKTAFVKIISYDPNNTNFQESFPGTLIGISNNGVETGLISEGMITVKITDATGNKLQVGNNKKVRITMPASNKAPAEIPLWHLNEKYGVWVEVGLAKKENNKYTFDVSHFSSYNLDYKIKNPVDFCIKFTDDDNNIYSHTNLQMSYKNNGIETVRTVITDKNGEICFKKGLRSEYNFKIKNYCASTDETELQSVNINNDGNYTITFKNKESIKNITKPFHFTGTVTGCNNSLIRPSIAFINYNNTPKLKRPLGSIFIGTINSDGDGKYRVLNFVKCAGIVKGLVKTTLSYIDVTKDVIYTTDTFITDLSNDEIKHDFNCVKASHLKFDNYFTLKETTDKKSIGISHKDKAKTESVIIENIIILDKSGTPVANYFSLQPNSKLLDKFDIGNSTDKKHFLVVDTNKGLFLKAFSL